jgi:hypothetical protein
MFSAVGATDVSIDGMSSSPPKMVLDVALLVPTRLPYSVETH